MFLDVNLHTLGLRPSAHTMSGECQIHLVSFHIRHVIQVLISGPRIVDFKMNRLQLFVYQKELLISRHVALCNSVPVIVLHKKGIQSFDYWQLCAFLSISVIRPTSNDSGT